MTHWFGVSIWISKWRLATLDFYVTSRLSYQFEKQPFSDVLQNRCSWKFCNIHRKSPVFVVFLMKLHATLLKREFSTCVFLWILWYFLEQHFYIEHLPWQLQELLVYVLPSSGKNSHFVLPENTRFWVVFGGIKWQYWAELDQFTRPTGYLFTRCKWLWNVLGPAFLPIVILSRNLGKNWLMQLQRIKNTAAIVGSSKK